MPALAVYFFQVEDPTRGPLNLFLAPDLSLIPTCDDLSRLRTFGDPDSAAQFFRDMGGKVWGFSLRFMVRRFDPHSGAARVDLAIIK